MSCHSIDEDTLGVDVYLAQILRNHTEKKKYKHAGL